jgi:hypothetical protein
MALQETPEELFTGLIKTAASYDSVEIEWAEGGLQVMFIDGGAGIGGVPWWGSDMKLSELVLQELETAIRRENDGTGWLDIRRCKLKGLKNMQVETYNRSGGKCFRLLPVQ